MGFNTFLTLATLGLAAAESSVVSLFMFDVNPENPQTLVGSIMGAESDTTTYSINCAKTVDSEKCAYLAGLLYTAGPTTIEYALQTPYDRYGTIKCSVGGTSTAVCTDLLPTTGPNSMAPQTTTLAKDQVASEAVTITAGSAAAATGSAATTDASNSSGTASQTSAGSASTSTGGMPHVTANPGIALGGAAAAFMVAAL